MKARYKQIFKIHEDYKVNNWQGALVRLNPLASVPVKKTGLLWVVWAGIGKRPDPKTNLLPVEALYAL